MRKPSNSKGFWGSVTVTGNTVTEERPSYKVTGSVTPQKSDLLEQYKSNIQMLRSEWLRVPTKTGRPKKGPTYYAVTVCTEEEGKQYGLTSSKTPKAKRWVCKTCLGLCVPVWADGPLPDMEEIENDWAEYMKNREIRRF